jgi:uncharacterized RmlC-like cupin family protein
VTAPAGRQPRLLRAGTLPPGQPTPGMRREEAFAGDGTWTGVVHTDAGAVSGWHHHGGHSTTIYVVTGRFRLEYPDGAGLGALDAGPGDFLHVPPGLVHREANPGDRPSTAVLLRTGTGPVVVNVAAPPGG